MPNQNRRSGYGNSDYYSTDNSSSNVSSGYNTRSNYSRSNNQQYASSRQNDTQNARRQTAGRSSYQSNVRPVQTHGSYRNPQGSSQYRDYNRYTTRQPKQRNFKPLIIFLAVLVALGVGVTVFMMNRTYPVTINGIEVELKGSHTLESLVEEGYAQKIPGDLLAIDGSILTAGEGEPYSVIINEEAETNFAREVQEDDNIVYGRGLDKTESTTESTAPIPWQYLKEDGYGPIHAFIGKGVDGVTTTTTGDISGIVQEAVTQEPDNIVYKKYYPDTGDDKVIALTIDDGPWPETTEEILDILDQYGVKATFFTIGEQIDQSDYNKGLIKRMQDSGHQVCTHTYDHASGSGGGVDIGKMSDEEQIQEVTHGQEVNAAATGAEANKVFRAPGGNFSDYSADLLRPYVSAEIGWTIDTNDWRLPGASEIAYAMTSATSGDIILCHDGGGDRTQTVEALRTAVPALIDQGYTFVTMDEMLAYPPSESE